MAAPSSTVADWGGHWLQGHAAVYISFDEASGAVRLLNAGLCQFVDIEIVI